jgi:hypothetical protein
MPEKEKEITKRRPYVKPKLEEVKLVADEAVLASCKSQNVSGPGEPSQGACGPPWGHCKSSGS